MDVDLDIGYRLVVKRRTEISPLPFIEAVAVRPFATSSVFSLIAVANLLA